MSQMEEKSNKTIICSVLFLDIAEYAKKSVAGQISLKDRFNTYLSEAIADVPVADRIILDTGDGAAVNFIGDVEAALNAALRLRTSLLGEDPYLDPPLLVRIGINLGPVRLVRDINGQPNIVGDGINVAHRIMGFAESSQILVSRSYYDAVSGLSPQYPGMFHYQGSRTDKHVREHEIYAIGYPGDHKRMPEITGPQTRSRPKAIKLSQWADKIKQASAARRLLYAATGAVILLALLLMPRQATVRHVPVVAPVSSVPATLPASAPATISVVPASVVPASAVPAAVQAKPRVSKAVVQQKHKVVRDEKGVQDDKLAAEFSREAYVSVSCKEGAKLFLDGTPKGIMGSEAMMLTTSAGKHKIIITHPSFGVYDEDFVLMPGKTKNIRPKKCN